MGRYASIHVDDLSTIRSNVTQVVPDSSSSFESREYGNDHIHANHMNMCRFGDRASDGYEKFQFRLKEYVDDLLEIRRIVAQAEAAAEHARRQGSQP